MRKQVKLDGLSKEEATLQPHRAPQDGTEPELPGQVLVATPHHPTDARRRSTATSSAFAH
jgi:hypothetical protein